MVGKEDREIKNRFSSADPQKAHFNKIAQEYDRHYSDAASHQYREKFINRALTENLDLAGKNVLEAMCGGGAITRHLLGSGAKVTGLDISEEMIRAFKKRWPDCKALCASIFDNTIPDNSFDAVIIVGGLHHLQPKVEEALDEFFRILKPGGFLCFFEPHAGALPDFFRKIWYRFDKLFEQNEAAIDLDKLKAGNRRFEFVKTQYGGNIAYLLVYNSFIFRVPLKLKRLYAPFIIRLEKFLNRFQGKRLSCYVISQWQKPFNPAFRDYLEFPLPEFP